MNQGDIVVGRFEIEGLAAQGGMGAVYRARDLHTGEPVAFKILRDTKHSYNEEQRFAREARLLAELSHPSIVRYVAHGLTPVGTHYLAMEWLEGEDLSGRLARTGHLSIHETVTLARHVAEALSAAHARGILHRDLKPQNLLLASGDMTRVKLVDFGIARFLARTHPLTRSQVFVGTPSYAAPEQVRDTREVDTRADVFSLGCVLFECLTGRPPFVGEHVMAILAKVLFEEAPHVHALREGVPPALGDLIARLLAKDPAARPADASAVAAELAAITIKDEPSSSREQSAVARSVRSTGERRLVSIILAAPAAEGDTAAEETLSVEEVTAPFERLRSLMGPLASQMERLSDGAVMVTFAGKNMATDQVVRAARCALMMSAALPNLHMVLVTGRSMLDGPLPVGEVIDQAVALMKAKDGSTVPHAPRPPIRVDDLTAGLLELRFTLGGEPGARLLLGERDSEEGMRTLLGKPTACVGRERELMMLQGLWRECVEEPLARGAIVVAEAGMGKSRLRYEFVRSVRRTGNPAPTVWLAQGDPIRAGLPFGLVAQLIRRVAELLDGDTLETRQTKLRAHVGRYLPDEDAARVAEFLGELVGTPFPDHDSARLRAARREPALMGDQMRRAWEDFLVAECQAHPLLVVIEDLHWGDAPSVQMMGAALQQLHEQPLMMLALARPEARELFPKLVNASGVQELRLGPLSRKASKRLGREVLGDSVPEVYVERIVERSTGNALFLEELLRAAAEGKEGGLPDTLLAMMQARLETLEPEAWQVMLAASIFGEIFWTEGVAALIRDSFHRLRVDDWLMVLIDREFLQWRAGGKSLSRKQCAFRHALMREAAYASLTEQERMLAHRLAAEWLVRAGEDGTLVLAESYGVIGEHFLRGKVWQKAADFFQRAGDAAIKLYAFQEARAHYENALTCLSHLPDTEEHRLRRLDVIMGYQSVAWLHEMPERSLARLSEAEKLARAFEGREGQWQLARVHAARGRTLCAAGDQVGGCDFLESAISIAEALNDEELSAVPLAVRGVVKAIQGHLGEAEASLVRAISPLARMNDWTNWIMVVGLRATVLAMCGRYEEGTRTLAPLLPRAKELNSQVGISLSHVYAVYTHFAGGNSAKVIEHGHLTIEAAHRSGDVMLVWAAHWMSAWAHALLAEQAAEEQHAEQARLIFEQFDGKLFIADWYLATEAARVLLKGRPVEALALAEKAVQRSRMIQGMFGEALAQRSWGQALAAVDARQWTDAEARLSESVRLLERCGAKLELARTHRAWGLVGRDRGVHDEARVHFERAATIFETCGNLQELEGIRVLLATL
jgi:serine/threonine protein kinase/tetratricopeptide (TPR) repeat protein